MRKKAAVKHTADALDMFSEEWVKARPDLNFAYLATIGRILRLSTHLRDAMDEWLAPFGITWEMFDLLASLQRSGGETGLRPTDLYKACMLSSGATTNRIDRAEKLNYAIRSPDLSDRRATRIVLTKKGAALTHKAMTQHAAKAGKISGHLSRAEQKQLAALLNKLLLCFETRQPSAEPGHRPSAASSAGTPMNPSTSTNGSGRAKA